MQEWHYAKNGVTFGPVSLLELRRLAESGQVQGDDLVWKEGMSGWIAASEVEGLLLFCISKSPPISAGDALSNKTSMATTKQSTELRSASMQLLWAVLNKYLTLAVVIVGTVTAIFAFLWAHNIKHGDLQASLRLSSTILALSGAVIASVQMRQKRKASGLTNEQFIVQEAGGAEGLQKVASRQRIAGHVFTALPFAIAVIGVITKLTGLLLGAAICGVPFIPIGIFLYWQSGKTSRIAAQAGAQISH